MSLYVLALLTLLHALSLTDRFLLSAFGTQITTDLALSNQQFGLVSGLAFTLFYAGSGPVAGLLVDRFGPGPLLGVGVMVWSAMTALTGLAKSFMGLWMPRSLVGIGEAILLPAASKILSARFDPRFNATVFGLFFMGGHAGVGLAFGLGGSSEIAWRDAFIKLGALGCGLALLVWLSVRWLRVEQFDSESSTSGADIGHLVRVFIDTLRNNRRLQLALFGLALVHVLYVGMQFLQLWLVQEKGFLPEQASSLYGSVYLLTAIPATILGGLAADQFARFVGCSRALFVSGVLLVCWPAIFAFRLSEPSSPFFLVGMVFSIAAFAFPYGAMITVLVEEAPDTIKALVMSAGLFAGNVLVIGTGSFLLGLSADWMASAGIDRPLTRSLLAADGLLLLAVLTYFVLHRASRSL